MMKGLAPQTSEVFERITRLECIKPFVLVGGTALSLQLNKRQSEDLDFMSWKRSAKDKPEVPISAIFYAAPRKRILSMQVVPFKNNLQLADIKAIGAMKMEAMLRRNTFRDYYDIYTILNEGVDIQEMIDMALEHSGHLLKRKNLLAILCDGERFRKDKTFMQLNPVYDITPYDIQEYIKQKLLESKAEQL